MGSKALRTGSIFVLIIGVIVLGRLYMYGPSKPSQSPGAIVVQQAAVAKLGQKPTTTIVSYTCAKGNTITAGYNQGPSTPASSPDAPPTPGGSVMLTFSDRGPMLLPQTISADGARYADRDDAFVFWNKGNGVMILQDGVEKDYTNCVQGVVAPNVGAVPTLQAPNLQIPTK